MKRPELHVALESIFRRRIAGLRRARSPYSSSFTIEELEVDFGSSETLSVIFKNLSPDAMLEVARRTRPGFLYTSEREIQVYRSVLSPLDLGAPKFYGAIVEPALETYWLFLERAPGLELYKIGEFDVWLEAARWLARFHTSCATDSARTDAPLLLQYDESYYRQWLERAHESVGRKLDRIAGRYSRVINVLLELPSAVIHGEYYASNIFLHEEGGHFRVCPVDWEVAAIGPALMDAAALASGKWNLDERLRILAAYYSGLPDSMQVRDRITALDCCQLHIAIQWLGWSRTWNPPKAHKHDWLAEALRISEQESLTRLFS